MFDKNSNQLWFTEFKTASVCFAKNEMKFDDNHKIKGYYKLMTKLKSPRTLK